MDVEDLVMKPQYYYQPPFVSISYLIIFLTVWFVVMVTIYSQIMKTKILNDWANQRCTAAGIALGDKENIVFCSKKMMGDIVSKATQPLTYGTQELTGVFGNISNQLQSARTMFNYMRNSITSITQDIMGRIMMALIPLQTVIIATKDVLNRMIAILTTAMYMGLATILTMKKILEMIVSFVIVILISLAASIVVMWIFPFSWSAAILFTAIFVSISIPLASFVKQISKVTDLDIPSIPKAPHMCFDKYTKIQLLNGTYCSISKLKLGQQLLDGSYVTAKLKLSPDNCKLYYLKGVLVTGSHLVKWKTTWIPVSNHPKAVHINGYKPDAVYCINTTNGQIKVGELTFTDWDEMLENDFILYEPKDVISLSTGYQLIKHVKINDVLSNGQIVTGVAKVLDTFEKIKYHLYTKVPE